MGITQSSILIESMLAEPRVTASPVDLSRLYIQLCSRFTVQRYLEGMIRLVASPLKLRWRRVKQRVSNVSSSRPQMKHQPRCSL